MKPTHTMARQGRPFTDHKPPSSAPVWAAIEGLARYHVLVAALELGVFEALSDGPATPEALAAELGASAPHLRSLLDGVVALGLLDRAGDACELNDTARRYLVADSPASMVALVPVAPGPHANWAGLADTVRSGRPAHPVEEDPAAFYVPLVEGTFATMLRCATRADLKLRYSATPAARVLDLGAGGAPWSIAVLSACPRGTAVVNDLPGVLDVARRTLTDHGVEDRAELRPGDFHTVDIEAVPTTWSCWATCAGPRAPTARDTSSSGPTARWPPAGGSSWPTISSTPSAAPTPTPCSWGHDDGVDRAGHDVHHRPARRLAPRCRLRRRAPDRADRLPAGHRGGPPMRPRPKSH